MSLPLLLLLLQAAQPAKPQETSTIAARVDNQIITWDEVDLRLARIGKDIPDLQVVRQQELRKIVQERLFQLEGKRLNISITEAEVDATVDRVKKTQIARQGESKEEIDQHFEEWLRVVERKSYAEYRAALRLDLLAASVRRRLVQDSFRAPTLYSTLLAETVTPDEIRDYYDKNRDRYKPILQIYVSRIGLQFNPAQKAGKEEKLAIAESLKRKIDAGADFRALLAVYNEIRGEKSTDGVLVLRPEDSTFGPEINQLLFHGLPENKVSGIVVDEKSVNLFKMERRVDEKGDTFEEAQGKIRAELENRKNVENRKSLRAELLSRYYVRPADLFAQQND